MRELRKDLFDDRGLPRGLFFSPRIEGGEVGKKKRGALLMIKAKRDLPGEDDKTTLTTSVSLAGSDFYEAYEQAVTRLANFYFYNKPSSADITLLAESSQAFLDHYGLHLRTVSILVDA